MPPLRLIFAGSGAFGLPTLRALVDAKHDIAQVYTQPDRPAGRGRKLTPTPIAQLALERALPLTRTENINAERLPPADVMVVIAFGQKIADAQVNHPRLGSLNLHASRLPRHRGAAPIHWAILAGDTVTGNSVIRLAQRMDAGAILAQSELPIGELETTGELHDRLAADGAEIVPRVLDALAHGTAHETPQDEALATLAPKLDRSASLIDWQDSPPAVARRIRAMYPWPGCRVQVLDASGAPRGRITLIRAQGRPERSAGRHPPGHILPDATVACADGAIAIIDVQPEGKAPMSLAAYRNGHPWDVGMRLESLA